MDYGQVLSDLGHLTNRTKMFTFFYICSFLTLIKCGSWTVQVVVVNQKLYFSALKICPGKNPELYAGHAAACCGCRGAKVARIVY